jgi:hypothetical protein
MSPSAFLDRGSAPTRAQLESVLGKTTSLWTELQRGLASTFAPLSERWSFSGKTHGWLLQLKRRDKTVVNLVPCRDHFVASLALSEDGCETAHGSGLTASVVSLIEQAPKYPEGRGVRLEVRNRKDVVTVQRLAAIRMASRR